MTLPFRDHTAARILAADLEVAFAKGTDVEGMRVLRDRYDAAITTAQEFSDRMCAAWGHERCDERGRCERCGGRIADVTRVAGRLVATAVVDAGGHGAPGGMGDDHVAIDARLVTMVAAILERANRSERYGVELETQVISDLSDPTYATRFMPHRKAACAEFAVLSYKEREVLVRTVLAIEETVTR